MESIGSYFGGDHRRIKYQKVAENNAAIPVTSTSYFIEACTFVADVIGRMVALLIFDEPFWVFKWLLNNAIFFHGHPHRIL